MKKVLLPTDFSDNARNAIEYAIGIFSYEEVSYTLLNVYKEPHSGADMLISIKDLLEKESKLGLKNEYEYIKGKLPIDMINMEQRSEYGYLSPEINRIVEKENIDCVVMGTKGATGMKKALVGSNTSDVVKNIKCPVLAIPESATYKPPLRIAFSTDYKELKDQYVLDVLVELAEQYQSELMVVNVNIEEPAINVKQAVEGVQLHHKLEGIPHHFYESEHKNITKGLDHFVQEYKIDILAMVARQHRFFDHLFHSSATEQMSMLSRIPLLVLNEK